MIPDSVPPVVNSCVEAWRTGPSDKWRRIAANILDETALSLGAFEALLTDLANELALCAHTPEDCWTLACRRHQYKGPPVPGPLPSVLGRAVPLDAHAKGLSASPAVSGLSPDQARLLLIKVVTAGAAVSPRDERILRRGLLGRYVIWATFSSTNPDESPFLHLPRTTEAVRTALGLGDCPETETLLLISYRTAGPVATLGLFRPTVGDAGDYSWFRPHPDPAATYGLTAPLPPNPGRLAPQPEVVHGAVSGETLLFPLYRAG